eukprot:Tamp_07780.p1 GENE.Tamp_07780~~Tamp_07780.p1  ORF type:complete len:775 (-),score=172.86 Tamp_07780:113-2437(-)
MPGMQGPWLLAIVAAAALCESGAHGVVLAQRARSAGFVSPVWPAWSARGAAGALRGQRVVRSPLLGLRAQVEPGRIDEGGNKAGGGPAVDWDAVGAQWSLFRKMALPYFQEEKSARMLLAIVIAFTLLNSGVSVGFSYLSKDFYNALNSKNTDEFYPLLRNYALALTGGTPVAVLYKFYRDKLAVQWRAWMTQRILDMYEANRSYYALEMKGDLDNPDQRIAEDARSFTRTSLDFSITLMTSVIDLVSFSGILYSIYPQLFAAIIAYSSFGTGMTLWLGQALVQKNFKQLQREADFRFSLVRMRENAESIAFYGGEALEMKQIKTRFDKTIDNYFSLIATQRNLELFTVAYRYMVQVIPAWVVAPLYFQGKIQLGVVSQSYGAFNHILSDLSIIVNSFEEISAFGAGIGRLGNFVEVMETNQLAAASQNGSLAASYSSASSDAPESAERDAAAASEHASKAGWERVTWGEALVTAVSLGGLDVGDPAPFGGVLAAAGRELVPVVGLPASPLADGARRPREGQEQGEPRLVLPGIASAVGSQGGPLLQVEDLTLTTPDGSRLLCRDLSLSIGEGEHVLIVGESGAGKSSLLRAVAGLWTAGKGHIRRPPPGDTFFLPQRPYCTLGTLREQLLYPMRPGDTDVQVPSDAELLETLDKVRLPNLAARLQEADGGSALDSVRDWSSMLSLGEQQRLGFARLLVNSPRLAILDEASSALDLDSEKAMYELLAQRKSLTYISVGHRPSLLAYHDTKLRLKAQGFQVESILQGKSSEAATL